MAEQSDTTNPSSPSPDDADLLALGEKWSTHLDEMNSGAHTVDGDLTDEANAHDEAMRWEIVKTPAHTVQGVLLKMRIVWEEHAPPGGIDQYVGTRAIRETLRDLERMAAD